MVIAWVVGSTVALVVKPAGAMKDGAPTSAAACPEGTPALASRSASALLPTAGWGMVALGVQAPMGWGLVGSVVEVTGGPTLMLSRPVIA